MMKVPLGIPDFHLVRHSNFQETCLGPLLMQVSLWRYAKLLQTWAVRLRDRGVACAD